MLFVRRARAFSESSSALTTCKYQRRRNKTVRAPNTKNNGIASRTSSSRCVGAWMTDISTSTYDIQQYDAKQLLPYRLSFLVYRLSIRPMHRTAPPRTFSAQKSSRHRFRTIAPCHLTRIRANLGCDKSIIRRRVGRLRPAILRLIRRYPIGNPIRGEKVSRFWKGRIEFFGQFRRHWRSWIARNVVDRRVVWWRLVAILLKRLCAVGSARFLLSVGLHRLTHDSCPDVDGDRSAERTRRSEERRV